MKARKRFGQHFLTEQGVLNAIAAAVALQPADAVFEIGPGHGALTEQLYVDGMSYLAVEIDRDLIPHLKARYPSIRLVNEDILGFDLNRLEVLAGENVRIVGNLPYNISSPLLIGLSAWVREHSGLMRDGHFMLQREFAQRLCAGPGSKAWGRLSVMMQLTFEVELLFDVAPESFTPPPRVWSSLVRLVPTTKWSSLNLDEVQRINELTKKAFGGRRKKITNALKDMNLDWQRVGVDAGARADDLSLQDFVKLARADQEREQGLES